MKNVIVLIVGIGIGFIFSYILIVNSLQISNIVNNGKYGAVTIEILDQYYNYEFERGM